MPVKKTRSRKKPQTLLLIGKPDSVTDIRYLSGFSAPDEIVYLQHGRAKYLVVSELEYGRACKTVEGARVMTPRMLNVPRKRQSIPANWAVALLNTCDLRACAIPPWMEHGTVLELQRQGIKLKVDSGDVERRRMKKTSEELRALRQSQRAAVAAMKNAKELLVQSRISRKGQLVYGRDILTAETVRVIIEKTLLEHQCTTPVGTIVACGEQACDPHEAGHGPLRAHTPIVIDIFPRHSTTGYWGDLTRTFIKGKPLAELTRLYCAVKFAQSKALSLVRPGVKACSIHRCVDEVFRARGYVTEMRDGMPVGFIHSTGHGVGLDIHEAPRVSRNTDCLRVGHVITIEPGLYYPELGGIRIEDTVEVTVDGWKALAPMSKSWLV